MSFNKVIIEKMAYSLPPHIVSSEELEENLAPIYERLNLQVGRLELMTGIKERRFWDSTQQASQSSAEAGLKLLNEGNIDPNEVDLLIHSAVCRDRLEPATASYVHNLMGLGPDTQILDVSNACLGFLNALILAGSMIEQGTINRAIIVAGENGKPLVDETVRLLNESNFDRKSIKPYFANLTIGGGAVAWSLCRKASEHAACPSLSQFASSTDTSHNRLCEGDQSMGGMLMQTDSEELLHAGIKVATLAWKKFLQVSKWDSQSPELVVTHQVGKAHQFEIEKALGYDSVKSFTSYESLGNCGSVSLPITYTLACEQNQNYLKKKSALLGIGSGLSSLMLALNN
jgi:3-oxoacyl-[acyl-carrier-protein] synthase-3